MSIKNQTHTFHIPVMGLSYTIDSPIRVAHLGITSVVSITDDELTERLRGFYSKKFLLPYREITKKCSDYRAERIKEYLNMLNKVVSKKFQEFKQELLENKATLESYITFLPDGSHLKSGLQKFIDDGIHMKEQLKDYLSEHLTAGAIDVNIMTKVD